MGSGALAALASGAAPATRLIAVLRSADDKCRIDGYKQVQPIRCAMDEVARVEASHKKQAAGLLAIFIGGLGIHKFVLGYSKPGIIMLVICLVGGLLTCGVASFVMGVIGLIEGIIYLTKTPEEFQATYIDGRKEWF